MPWWQEMSKFSSVLSDLFFRRPQWNGGRVLDNFPWGKHFHNSSNDAPTVPMMFQQFQWCFSSSNEVTTVPMMLQQFQWCCNSSNDAATALMMLQQFQWCPNSSNGAPAVPVMLQQFQWCSSSSNDAPAVAIMLQQFHWCSFHHVVRGDYPEVSGRLWRSG